MTTVLRRAGRAMRTPAFGVAVIAPLVLVGAVGASAPIPRHAISADGFTPLAAVARTGDGQAGAAVVAATKPIKALRIVAGTSSPAPPPIVMAPVGSMRIPIMALNAYRNAERMMASATPACGVSWNLLAGIGRIESLHANGGATDASGTPIKPIYGPTLDGTLAGNEVIVQSVQAGRVTYARAMGPMQFLPGTWARYASDGDGDGKADVQNLFDSTLAAARYLCSGGMNLRDQSHVLSSILRYNNSMAYARNVLGWAAAYATGVEPVDLPEISGSPPAISDVHLDIRTRGMGLGPDLPLSAAGLPASDPLAVTPLFDNGQPNVAGQIGAPGASPGPLPGPTESTPRQNCQVFCIQSRTPAPQPGALPGMPPPAGLPPAPPAAPFLPMFPPPPPPPPLFAPPAPFFAPPPAAPAAVPAAVAPAAPVAPPAPVTPPVN
jgi:membrane-bound lytic murein transglycosylase B